MAIVPLEAGGLSARAKHHLFLHPEPTKHTNPPFTQPYAGMAVDSYAIIKGYPTEDPGYGISSASFAGPDAATATAGVPGVLAVDMALLAAGSPARPT